MSITTFENFDGVITYNDLVGFSVNVNSAFTGTQYYTNIGDGANSSIIITHNTGSEFLIVTTKEIATGNIVFPDIVHNDSNTITLNFVYPPSTNQYTVYIK